MARVIYRTEAGVGSVGLTAESLVVGVKVRLVVRVLN